MMSDRTISWIVEKLEEKIMQERAKHDIPDFAKFENDRIIALNEALDLICDTSEEDIPEDYLY